MENLKKLLMISKQASFHLIAAFKCIGAFSVPVFHCEAFLYSKWWGVLWDVRATNEFPKVLNYLYVFLSLSDASFQTVHAVTAQK